jgi:putative ABC transport system substrate-binding protein
MYFLYKRREFITLIGGAAAAWPLAARAQQATTPVIGWLAGGTRAGYASFADAFRKGLNDIGYVESRNVVIEYQWTDGQDDRAAALAEALVRRQVAVIAAAGTPAAFAAKAATATIPIVFSTSVDPVEAGLVAALNRPGGNATGVSLFGGALAAKRLQLLQELVPTPSMIALLVNPSDAHLSRYTIESVQGAARTIPRDIHVLTASTESEIDAAFLAMAQLRPGAALIANDGFYTSQRHQIVALAGRQAFPTMYGQREFPAVGGLLSYGISYPETYRQVGLYAGRILKGEKPADLPIMRPAKFELVINLKTASTLGLKIPDKLLALADEVIE